MVAGGTGFIGEHLCRRLRELSVQVVATGTGRRSLPDIPVAAVDARDAEAVRKAVERSEPFDFVFNLAGYIDHTPWAEGGRAVYEQHALGAANLVEATWGPELEGFVQVGSSDEYGDGPAPQSEGDLPRPISPYSAGKLAATNLVGTLGRTEGFPGVTARLFLVYGPGQAARRFLPQVITACLRGEEVATTPGEQLRDFCYVEDVVDGLILCAREAARLQGEVFNLASGEPVSIRQMTELVRKEVGWGEILYGDRPYRPDENMELYADVEKARDMLGWEPSTALEEGLRHTVAAYREDVRNNTSNDREGSTQ